MPRSATANRGTYHTQVFGDSWEPDYIPNRVAGPPRRQSRSCKLSFRNGAPLFQALAGQGVASYDPDSFGAGLPASKVSSTYRCFTRVITTTAIGVAKITPSTPNRSPQATIDNKATTGGSSTAQR